MNLMAAASEFEAELGGDDSAAAISRITGNADLHASPKSCPVRVQRYHYWIRRSGRGCRLWDTVAKSKPVSYHRPMRAVLAVYLLCAVFVSAQGVPAKVQTGSRVPAVTIRFTGQDSNSYKFLIQNTSGQSVTAFDVLLVPRGVPKRGNRFLCQGRCSDSNDIDTIDTPAIRAGGTKAVSYAAGTIAGGAVIVEAAIFDSGTYGGSERAAAYLIADQMGDQAEFDGIVSAVDKILGSSGPQSSGKGAQIGAALAGLATDADSATMAAFYRWFPNLKDCDGQFPGMMKNVRHRKNKMCRRGLISFWRAAMFQTRR